MQLEARPAVIVRCRAWGADRVDALSRMAGYRVCTELQFIIRGFTATSVHTLSVLLCVTPMI